jgi:hypothetical protein
MKIFDEDIITGETNVLEQLKPILSPPKISKPTQKINRHLQERISKPPFDYILYLKKLLYFNTDNEEARIKKILLASMILLPVITTIIIIISFVYSKAISLFGSLGVVGVIFLALLLGVGITIAFLYHNRDTDETFIPITKFK